ncbi:MAG: hypothetical protein HQL67_06670 [Magnetococcales bacterium]|nr:hypothetical protein [Magnetococcales bacterium]
MATVVFYEKPGCINNLLQRTLLKNSGHVVTVRNILTTQWSADKLRWFCSGIPVNKWFNRSAPQVKSGMIVPAQLSEEQALELMVSNPLLIRRPLMDVSGFPVVGFDLAELDRTIGLVKGQPSEIGILKKGSCQSKSDPSSQLCQQSGA